MTRGSDAWEKFDDLYNFAHQSPNVHRFAAHFNSENASTSIFFSDFPTEAAGTPVYILLIGMFCQQLYVPTTDTWYEQSAMGNYLTEVVLSLDITRKVMELSVNYNECGATTKDATQLGFLKDVYYFLVDLYYYFFFLDISNYFNHLLKLFTMEYNLREVLTTNLSYEGVHNGLQPWEVLTMDLSFFKRWTSISKRRDVPGTTTTGGAYNMPFFFKRWTSNSKRRDAPVPD